MDKLKNIIENRLKELNLGPVEAAVKVGLERGYIRDFLENRKNSFRQDKLQLLAKALELDLPALIEGKSVPIVVSQDQENNVPNGRVIGPAHFDSRRRIPVYGKAVAGVNGEFELNGNVLFDVLCPPQLQNVAGAYAVVVSGDSMMPRYFDGEIVYCDPTRRVKKGDFVVAQVMVDETASSPYAFVKRYCRHNDHELVLEQYNPAKELHFSHRQVVSVHYIAMSGDAA